MEQTETAARFAQLERSMRRRFRLVTGALLAVILVVNVAPVAADHLIVRSSDIVDGAVTTPKLRNSSVGTHKLKNGAVGTKKLKDRAVDTPDLRNGAVGTHKLKNGAVGTKKLKDGGVDTADIADGAVTNSKIRNGSVGPGKLSSNALPARGYARVFPDGTVTTGQNITSANITNPSTGVYCFHDLPFQPTLAVATADGVGAAVVANYWPGRSATCPSGTSFNIRVRWSDTSNPTSKIFNVVVM